MPAFGIFDRGVINLSKRTHRLRVSVLACLLAAWPFYAAAQATETRERLAVSHTTSVGGQPQDSLQQWFAEQDKILDDILTRLARIETLVNDIHRLVAGLPDQAQPAASLPVPAAVRSTAAQPPASPPTAPAPDDHADTLVDWAPQLAGAGLLILLLLWWLRRRTATPAPAPPHAPAAESSQAKPERPQATESAAEPVASAPPSAPQATTADIDLNLGSDQSDQALELAEIMLSMGLGHGAAQTLAEQIRSEPKQALRHWLKLLEVYRRNGQQAEFERSAEELRLHFNVKPEDWHAQPDTLHSVEDYPHITARLTELWGRPACLVYLQNLLADNRGGARSGFPQSVAEELLLLAAMLRSEGLVS